jgi:hypothetical protein
MRTKTPRWAAAITGSERDIAELAEHLPGPVRVYRGEAGWELTDKSWETLGELVDVHAAVQQLTTYLRALARLHIRGSQPIRFTGNIFERAGRSRHQHAIAAVERTVVRDQAFDSTSDADARAQHSGDRGAWDGALELARSDAAVARALDFMGVEPNWHTLSAALDAVRGDGRTGGDQGIIQNGWTTEAELERFKRAADAVGTEATHGFDAPAADTPMTLAEAEDVVARIVVRWIDRLARDSHWERPPRSTA